MRSHDTPACGLVRTNSGPHHQQGSTPALSSIENASQAKRRAILSYRHEADVHCISTMISMPPYQASSVGIESTIGGIRRESLWSALSLPQPEAHNQGRWASRERWPRILPASCGSAQARVDCVWRQSAHRVPGSCPFVKSKGLGRDRLLGAKRAKASTVTARV